MRTTPGVETRISTVCCAPGLKTLTQSAYGSAPGGILGSMDSETLNEAELRALIADIEARLADLQARLPAHSIPPGMIAQLDELDEALAEANARLAQLIATRGDG